MTQLQKGSVMPESSRFQNKVTNRTAATDKLQDRACLKAARNFVFMLTANVEHTVDFSCHVNL